MATLVLGSLGRLVAGPIGGILGTGLGGIVDRAILGGGGREPAPSADLTVQSAAYGQPIPIVSGRMRVAGNLIWTSGIEEGRPRAGGKGSSRASGASYSASFAVGLSGRAIVDIGRIWADGRVLRDADGVFASPVTMRLHRGSETQGPDPLIAAAEGSDGTPAYRGLAYAVFEDMPLADYGNRVPGLLFEIIADAGDDVGAGAVAVQLAGDAGLVATGVFPRLGGHAANRAGSIAESIAPLIEIAGAAVGGAPPLLLRGAGGDAVAIDPADGDAHLPGARPRSERRRDRYAGVASGVELGFYDSSRDYQIGLQRVRRSGAGIGSGPILQRAIAATLEPAAAKALAAAVLARQEAARVTATIRLPWRHLDKTAGSLVRLRDDATVWRVVAQRFEAFLVSLDLERTGTVAGPTAPPLSDGGRPARFDDGPPGPTRLVLLDLPLLPGEAVAGPRLLIAAAGSVPAWRGAAIAVSGDGGASFVVAGRASPATIGTTLTMLPPGDTAGWDRFAAVEVELLADTMWLEDRPIEVVLAGANLAAIGDEIIHFARAEALAPGRFRLSQLLRGRRGSEAAVDGHRVGEPFVLLDSANLLPVDPGIEALGSTWLVRAEGPGDGADTPAIATMVAGRALLPLAPTQLRVDSSGGDIRADWVRRSRTGFAWIDFVDAPLGEARDAYRVTVELNGREVRSIETTGPGFVYSAADRIADGGGEHVRIGVAQLSDAVGPGASVFAEIDLGGS